MSMRTVGSSSMTSTTACEAACSSYRDVLAGIEITLTRGALEADRLAGLENLHIELDPPPGFVWHQLTDLAADDVRDAGIDRKRGIRRRVDVIAQQSFRTPGIR
jgi:hypothetical protein